MMTFEFVQRTFEKAGCTDFLEMQKFWKYQELHGWEIKGGKKITERTLHFAVDLWISRIPDFTPKPKKQYKQVFKPWYDQKYAAGLDTAQRTKYKMYLQELGWVFGGTPAGGYFAKSPSGKMNWLK